MAVKSNMSILDKIAEIDKRISSYPEVMLGRGHNQPFNPSNSGPRKLLSSSQSDQTVPIKESELAIITTGTENQYGDLSSSVIRAEGDYHVIGIIDKYSFRPKHHYYIIFHDTTNKIYKLQEVRTDKHITEKHGYHFNISFMNSLSVGDVVPKGTIIRKSESYDEYDNRVDGRNCRGLYLSTERNTEDSVLYSASCAEAMGTTHFMNTSKIINAHSRLLDLYGESDDEYKTFPDVGEYVKNGMFCSICTATKEEELYRYTRSRLRTHMLSDDPVIIHGKVVDIDIHCNDPEKLNTYYNAQLKKYYDESMRFYHEVYDICQQILDKDLDAVFEYDLQKMYSKAKDIINGAHYINDGREFNFTKIDITIEQNVPLEVGDKTADRYGGKGVISMIIPDELMPIDDLGNRIDIIINSSTCINRENPGQLFEMSLTYISERLVYYIIKNDLEPLEAFQIILDFYEIVSPIQYAWLLNWATYCGYEESTIESYVSSVKNDQFIYLTLRAIQDNMTEDKLALLYDKFPFIDQSYLYVPIRDSNGNVRFVQSRRKAVPAMKYMYRLKQFAEDKFSATSLSATNIQNLNTKSKAFKRYRSAHSNTPIAMGSMESDELISVGQEFVISYLMVHSLSPMGRRLMKQALTEDPFVLDIQLDENCANRNVEKLNAYQKAKGVVLIFNKIRKVAQDLVTWKPQVNFKQDLVRKLDDDMETYIKLQNEILESIDKNPNLVIANLVWEMSSEEKKAMELELNKMENEE